MSDELKNLMKEAVKIARDYPELMIRDVIQIVAEIKEVRHERSIS